jgi:signal transduction histidine kinase
VTCFPNQINQVFMNILVNASQAIADKGEIFVETYTRGGDIVIEIRDTGKGISEEHLERIFDPGFTTKGVGVGTGLGLSIVHQIVADHGGSVEVSSEIGKGTTFRIILPIR